MRRLFQLVVFMLIASCAAQHAAQPQRGSFVAKTNLSTQVTGTLALGNGGTGQTSFSAGALVSDGGVLSVVAPGSNGNVLTSNGTAWTSAAGAGLSSTAAAAFDPGLRLSTASGNSNPTSDTTSGTLYYTPHKSGSVTTYDSSAWTPHVTAEISLSLTVTSGKNYDVFVYSNSGTMTLVLSAQWTNDTTRADALSTQDGRVVLDSDHSRLWIGVIRASASNTIAQQADKQYVWNTYQQVPRRLAHFESTTSWVESSTTYVSANSSSANAVEYVAGSAWLVSAKVAVATGCSPANNVYVGIGIDSTSSNSADLFGAAASVTTSADYQALATYDGYQAAGYHKLNWIEHVTSPGNCTFYSTTMGQAGITGWILGANDAPANDNASEDARAA